jgi:hypothetical protein
VLAASVVLVGAVLPCFRGVRRVDAFGDGLEDGVARVELWRTRQLCSGSISPFPWGCSLKVGFHRAETSPRERWSRVSVRATPSVR